MVPGDTSTGMPYNRPTVKALSSSFMPTTCVHSLSTAGIFWSILIWKSQKKCELLDIHPRITFTDAYVMDVQEGVTDYRDVIRPKHPLPDTAFQPRRYYQVYEQKHGFQPNLSILDLLFNEGPEAVLYL